MNTRFCLRAGITPARSFESTGTEAVCNRLFGNIVGLVCCLLYSLGPAAASAHPPLLEPKSASPATIAAQEKMRQDLPPEDGQDEAFANKGFIGTLADPVARAEDGRIVFDATQYDWIEGEAPPTVHPGLWRQQKLLRKHGLFKVADGVWQIRGLSTANMTIVEGDTGWIIIDTLATVEAAKRARELMERHLGKRPITGIIYSHSHPDHFGGTRAFIDDEDEVPVIAPEHFLLETVTEWGKAGASTSRRGNFIAGPREAGPKANVGIGIASSVDIGGTISIIPPTDSIEATGDVRVIDGVTMEFQMVPETEAPAEMNVFLPAQKTFYSAEITSCAMHNLQAPRGAEVRDGLKWAGYITEAIALYGDRTDVLIQGHCWPQFGKGAVDSYLHSQRDNYKFIHDQTVRLMNSGRTPTEVAEELEQPASLANVWSNRGYYGDIRHNAKGVYQRYTGWWSGIPADLNLHPPEEQARRYVKAIGSEEKVIRIAKEAMAEGDYRWSAELLNHLVFAVPDSLIARALLADSYEQMGYQSQSAAWRNIYLWGAAELRGAKPYDVWHAIPDLADIVPLDSLTNQLATMVVPEKIGDRELSLVLDVTDRERNALITVKNAVLVSSLTDEPVTADARIRGSQKMLTDLFTKQLPLEALEEAGLKVTGERQAVLDLLAGTELPTRDFPVVAPTHTNLRDLEN